MQSIIKNSYKKKKKAIFWLHFLNETGKLLPVFLWLFKICRFFRKELTVLVCDIAKRTIESFCGSVRNPRSRCGR